MSSPEKTEEWVYGGLRMNARGKRVHAWLDSTDRDKANGHWYADTGNFVIGGIYTVTVDRSNDALSRSRPVYTGDRVSSDWIRDLELADSVTRRRLAEQALERRDAKTSELETLLAPIGQFAATLRTNSEREALVSILTRTVYDAQRRTRNAGTL